MILKPRLWNHPEKPFFTKNDPKTHIEFQNDQYNEAIHQKLLYGQKGEIDLNRPSKRMEFPEIRAKICNIDREQLMTKNYDLAEVKRSKQIFYPRNLEVRDIEGANVGSLDSKVLKNWRLANQLKYEDRPRKVDVNLEYPYGNGGNTEDYLPENLKKARDIANRNRHKLRTINEMMNGKNSDHNLTSMEYGGHLKNHYQYGQGNPYRVMNNTNTMYNRTQQDNRLSNPNVKISIGNNNGNFREQLENENNRYMQGGQKASSNTQNRSQYANDEYNRNQREYEISPERVGNPAKGVRFQDEESSYQHNKEIGTDPYQNDNKNSENPISNQINRRFSPEEEAYLKEYYDEQIRAQERADNAKSQLDQQHVAPSKIQYEKARAQQDEYEKLQKQKEMEEHETFKKIQERQEAIRKIELEKQMLQREYDSLKHMNHKPNYSYQKNESPGGVSSNEYYRQLGDYKNVQENVKNERDYQGGDERPSNYYAKEKGVSPNPQAESYQNLAADKVRVEPHYVPAHQNVNNPQRTASKNNDELEKFKRLPESEKIVYMNSFQNGVKGQEYSIDKVDNRKLENLNNFYEDYMKEAYKRRYPITKDDFNYYQTVNHLKKHHIV